MQKDQLITKEFLQELPGIEVVHFNPKYNGGFMQYSLCVDPDDEDHAVVNLMVKFDRDPRYGRDFMVFLSAGTVVVHSIALWEVTTQVQFLALYALLAGKTLYSTQLEAQSELLESEVKDTFDAANL